MEIAKRHLKACLWMGLYLISQTIVMLVLFFAKIFSNPNMLLELSELSYNEMTIKLLELLSDIIVPSLLFLAVIVIFIFALYIIIGKKKELLKKISLETIFKYASIAILANIVISFIVSLIPVTSFTNDLEQSTSIALTGSFPIVLISIGILVPIMEEIIFRYGIGYNLYKINPKYGLIISSIIFGIMHGNLIQSLYAFILGLIFAYVDEKEESLLPSIIMHITINSSSVIASYTAINEFMTLLIITALLLTFYGITKLVKK